MHPIYNLLFPLQILLGISVTHGPIIGDLTSNSVRIWVRGEHTYRVPVDLIAKAGATNRHCGVYPRTNSDNTGFVQILNLTPDTRYAYSIDGETNETRWFRTRPVVDEMCRIAFGSCADEGEGSSSVWKQIDKDNATAMVLLGDTPYIDTTDLTIQRERYQAFSAVPAFANLVSHTPLYCTWDDHDFGRNDTDGNLQGKENSRKAFSEYRPNPSIGEYGQGIYTSFRQGPVEVFLLDTRWFARTEKSKNDYPTLLGKQQWQWLERSLKASKAPYKVLACGMIFNTATRPGKTDYWGGYPTEYYRLLSVIKSTKATGVVLVSGDIHWSRVVRHDTSNAIGYDLHEFITSPIHERLIAAADAPHTGLVFSIGEPNSFLLLEGKSENEKQTLSMSLKNASGNILYQHMFDKPPGLSLQMNN